MTLNSLKIIIPLVVLTLLLQGCGTIFFMGDSREEIIRDEIVWPVYSRFHFDLRMFYAVISPFNPDDYLSPSTAVMDSIIYGPWVLIICAADMPISLVIDTLTLPWDIRALRTYREQESDLPPESFEPMGHLRRRHGAGGVPLLAVDCSGIASHRTVLLDNGPAAVWDWAEGVKSYE